MPIITFWSNNEKSIGQSVSASVAATVMAMEHNYKILLISADFNNYSIENCFGLQESNKEIVKSLVKKHQISLESGIDGLLKLADSNRVTPDIIPDYTKIVFKNRLEVLYSPMNIEEKKEVELMEEFKNIILNASRYYDYVIVDLRKGMKFDVQLEILQMSDVIVENINQGIKTIEEFLKIDEIKNLKNKIVWNVCRYDGKSKYNTKNLARMILKKQMIYETPYNTLILEASQEGNMAELLLRFKTIKDDSDNSKFLSKIEELNEGILTKYNETRVRI